MCDSCFGFFIIGSLIDKESFCVFVGNFIKVHMHIKGRKRKECLKKSSRNQELDVAKGLGILLVVIGHGYSHTTNIELLIYGFHMPFFFIISGIIYGQKQVQFEFNLRKKIKTLIIPYLFFEIMWWLCIALMNVNNPTWNGTV